MAETQAAAAAWDAEYSAGRYAGEPPVPFVTDILDTARAHGLAEGLYIGCGTGRNYLPLTRDVTWPAPRPGSRSTSSAVPS